MREAYRVIDVPPVPAGCCTRDDVGSASRTNAFIDYLNTLASSPESPIDGDRISSFFFPDGVYDIFVSHSHADRGAACQLKNICAGEGYKAFVDSDTWLDVRDLIKTLLERNPSQKYGNILHLASNAYIILATALMQRINQAKVFVFLETRNSLPGHDGERYQTHSPWLKLELETCHLLSQRVLTEGHVVTGGMASYREFAYGADIDHLPDETYADLIAKIRNGALPRWPRTR